MTNNKQSFIQRLVLKKSFWLIFCVFFFSYPLYKSMNRELPPELPVLFELPDYKLIDSNGKFFGSEDLKGKPYIANFHFTSCPTICPEIMEKTQKIQKRFKGLGDKVAIVSFTVDPETDTPKVLFKKARELHANPFVWKFLTGTKDKLQDLIIKGFKVAMGEKVSEENNIYDIAHSSKIFLVDSKNRVRSLYTYEKNSINKLMIDMGLLINRLVHGANKD